MANSSAPPGQTPIPRIVIQSLTGLMALVAILGFAWILWDGILRAWVSTPRPAYSDSFVYFANGLTAFVGGIVAVGFGIKPSSNAPVAGPAPSAAPTPDRPLAVPTSRAARNLVGLAGIVAPSLSKIHVKAWLASIYAIIYVVGGICAVATSMIRTPETSTLVKTIATTFFGVMLPIIGAYLTD